MAGDVIFAFQTAYAGELHQFLEVGVDAWVVGDDYLALPMESLSHAVGDGLDDIGVCDDAVEVVGMVATFAPARGYPVRFDEHSLAGLDELFERIVRVHAERTEDFVQCPVDFVRTIAVGLGDGYRFVIV